MLEYESYLASAASDRPENLSRRARAIISKYSMLLDPAEQAKRRRTPELVHKDLRQAIHLIDVSLAAVPKTAQQAPLREWLHYRKARVLVQFAPATVPDAVAALEHEYPKSQLLDDALAEQLFAEGVMLRDINAAQRTFQRLVSNFPNANALDNAYTWMAIIYRCAGRVDEAQKINREIIRLFPTTRHARYAASAPPSPNPADWKHTRNGRHVHHKLPSFRGAAKQRTRNPYPQALWLWIPALGLRPRPE